MSMENMAVRRWTSLSQKAEIQTTNLLMHLLRMEKSNCPLLKISTNKKSPLVEIVGKKSRKKKEKAKVARKEKVKKKRIIELLS